MQKQLFGSELGTPELGVLGESGIRTDSRMNELMLLMCCLVTLVVSVIPEFAQEKPVFLGFRMIWVGVSALQLAAVCCQAGQCL